MKISRVLFFLAMHLLVSCSKESAIDMPTPNAQSRTVRVAFALPESSNQTHNYVYDGYNLHIQGFEKDTLITGLNLLGASFEAKIYGDVVLTLYHPAFIPSELSSSAYFGLDNYVVPLGKEAVEIPLELVQGFVIVDQEQHAGLFVSELYINGIPSRLEQYYYTASEQLTVFMKAGTNYISASDPLLIGHGVKYTVNLEDLNLNISFPDFDLNLPEPVILPKNVEEIESFKLHRDGTVTLYTGPYPTKVFIASEDLSANSSLKHYNLENLQATWKNTHGKPNYTDTAYTDIYVKNKLDQVLKIRILSNDYIFIYEYDSGKVLEEFGNNVNAAQNKKAYDEMLIDFGDTQVLKRHPNPQSTPGNFIWNAGSERGSVYVEGYQLE